MATHTRNWIMAGLISLLVACGGGGGGNRAAGVDPGPAPPGGAVPPPPAQPSPVAPYAEAEQLLPAITSVVLDDNDQPVVDFQLTNGNGTAITDLGASDVRFTIAKLMSSPLGNMTGTWQSYKNQVEDPGVGPGTESKLQATYERDAGEFTNHGDGTYTYHFDLSLTDLGAQEDGMKVLEQAAAEGLDLSYEPDRTHRVAMQFDGSEGAANPNYDWVPATGATTGISSMDIAATANCNRCHDPLGIHGGNRREIEYCVTCHNAGSTDANSGNTVDMKVMIHKIHMGANLPSVQAGGEYAIWGFRDSKHDYSTLHYPQDVRNCANCHAGSATGEEQQYPDGSKYTLTTTSQGDNWAEVSSQAACGSCHENLDFGTHAGGQPDDTNCASCHSQGGIAGSIQDSHVILTEEARKQFAAQIMSVTNTAPGEFPRVQYKVTDPTNGDAPYDLQNDPPWTVGGGASRLAIDLAWDTTDYTNTGNGDVEASTVSLDALQGTPVGDGSYIVESGEAVPDGSERPFIAADGSGVAGIEGHPAVDIGSDSEPDVQRIAFTNHTKFFSINEVDGQADPRRTVVDLNNCLNCHQTLSLHGSNRTDKVELCVACHNPRNTDREVREELAERGVLPPPTDGKDEESIDFKTMIHGIHAGSDPELRTKPLQIVGFGGFSTHVYDEDTVHYPGDLANCTACHDGDSYLLPLPSEVLASTIDTGDDHEDPTDDTVVTPVTAVCSSCHDGQEATDHMLREGGSFDTTQAAIDSGEVLEGCNVCHSQGRTADVGQVHNPH